MKHIKIYAFLIFLFSQTCLFAATYEASTLYNSVSRSETVQDLYFKRWEIVSQQSPVTDLDMYRLDIYGKINWLNNFNINTYNAGTGNYESIDMRLVRTYGSIIINIPLASSEEQEEQKLINSPNKYNENKDYKFKEESATPSFLNKRNFWLGFTASGFHYGLTRKTEIDRENQGTDTITDYKYSQFFDDIYALTVSHSSGTNFHFGLIVQNELVPDDDGTMHYLDQGNRTIRYFIDTNLLSFLNMNSSSRKDKLVSIAFALSITDLYTFLYSPPNPALQQFRIGYKLLRLYNDEPYDAVWVDSPYTTGGSLKTDFMPASERDKGNLHTMSAELETRLWKYFLLTLYTEFQHIPDNIYDKRDNKKIDPAPAREARAMLAFSPFAATPSDRDSNPDLFVISFGMSSFWDPGIAVHRESGSGYRITGWLLAIDFNWNFLSLDLAVYKNYSDELRKLVEAADKYAFEFSVDIKL